MLLKKWEERTIKHCKLEGKNKNLYFRKVSLIIIVDVIELELVIIFCQKAEVSWTGCMRSHTLSLTGVLQPSLPARCRLEVTSGTIRERRLPRVCQWNMRPDTSASSWLGLFLPLCSWEVWKGDTPMLTLLCPACHLTFMLDVSSPAAAIQSPQPWHRTRRTHGFKLWPQTWGREGKQSTGQEAISIFPSALNICICLK